MRRGGLLAGLEPARQSCKTEYRLLEGLKNNYDARSCAHDGSADPEMNDVFLGSWGMRGVRLHSLSSVSMKNCSRISPSEGHRNLVCIAARYGSLSTTHLRHAYYRWRRAEEKGAQNSACSWCCVSRKVQGSTHRFLLWQTTETYHVGDKPMSKQRGLREALPSP